MPFRRPLGIVEQYHAEKENIPPSNAKPFELHPTWSKPEFEACTYKSNKVVSNYMRQKLLDGWKKNPRNDIATTEKEKFMAVTKRSISAEWYRLEFGALTDEEQDDVEDAAKRCWEEELPVLRRRFEADVKQWETDVLDKVEAAKSCIRECESKEKQLSNLVEDSRYRFRKHKLEGEISWAKRFTKDREQQYIDLQDVFSLTLEARALDLGIVWRSYDVVKKNEKKPAAKKAGRKTRAAGQRSQKSPVPVRNVTTGITEYGHGRSKPDAVQEDDTHKRKRKPTQQELSDRHARRVQDQFKAVKSDDSEGESDLDEVFGKPPPIKKRKTSPTSDGLPAERGVARHVNRSEPLKKATGKKNTPRQRNYKNSPVPTTSSDSSKSSSNDEKDKSSSPPTSNTSASSKRKQSSSTNSEEPASKKQMLGHSGNGQRVLGSSNGSKDTNEPDSAYASQSDTSRHSDRKVATPKSRKSMSPPPRQQPRSLPPKRKRVSESDEQESASKKQALEVDGSQTAAPVTNNLNSEDEKVELEPEESVKSVETSESNTNRKMAMPKTRKDSPSVTTPPSTNTLNSQRQLDSSDEEPNSHEEQSSAFSDKTSVGSASVRSVDTSSECNTVEEQSIRDNKEDERPDIANKGKEEEQAVKETKEGGENNDSSAPVVPNTSEVPSPAPVAAPDVPKTKKIRFKDFNLKDYEAARPELAAKCKVDVEDIGKANVQQSDGEAQVEEFGSLFEGLGEKVIW